MKSNKNMLIAAIRSSDILPSKQGQTLEVICLSDFPLSAKSIEKKLSINKQSINYSLTSLLKRHFITREKDGFYVYRPNYERVEELIQRYKQNL